MGQTTNLGNVWEICPQSRPEREPAALRTAGLPARTPRRIRIGSGPARRWHRLTRLRASKRVSLRARPLYRNLLQATSGRLRLCGSTGGTLPTLPAPLRAASPRLPLNSSAMLAPLRAATYDAAQECGFSAQQTYDLLLAVGEAATNAVVHAHGGEARVRADTELGIVQIWITDTGPGISEVCLRHVTHDDGFSTAGTLGQGFRIMLQTCGRLFIATNWDTGTSVVLVQSTRALHEPNARFPLQRRRRRGERIPS